jgi:hypothetical protein
MVLNGKWVSIKWKWNEISSVSKNNKSQFKKIKLFGKAQYLNIFSDIL